MKKYYEKVGVRFGLQGLKVPDIVAWAAPTMVAPKVVWRFVNGLLVDERKDNSFFRFPGLYNFHYVMQELCGEADVHKKLSRDYCQTQLNDEKEVQETRIKVRAVSEEFREDSRNIPRAWVQVQACRHKINITSGSLQHLDIEKELDWGSAECCVGTSASSYVNLSAHPKRIDVSPMRPSDRDELNLRGEEFGVFQVPTLPLTFLCYFWQRRAGAVAGPVFENVIISVREKPMCFPGTVFKERQCIEVTCVYCGELSRKAESDVTELWLADDFDSLVC